jgi:hypothetical protein
MAKSGIRQQPPRTSIIVVVNHDALLDGRDAALENVHMLVEFDATDVFGAQQSANVAQQHQVIASKKLDHLLPLGI